MWFKGIDFFPHSARIPVMEWRWICITISTVLAVLSLFLVYTKGLHYSIDFKGGSLLEIQQKSGPIDLGALRQKLNGLGLGDIQIQSVGTDREALVRVAQQDGDDKVQQAATDKVKAALGGDIEIRRTEIVGPAVSSELLYWCTVAVICAVIGILLYIWFRFEWQFGLAAIIALVHDIIITIGVLSLLEYEFGLTEVAALLTLAGYSVNDTVVVFDRIRENLRKYKKMPLTELMNLSVNETLSRTVLTATTTFLAVLALFILGTEAIRGFSFTMLFGIIIGTWSSIFVAAPFLLWIGIDRESTAAEPTPVGAAKKAKA